jgi:hypothetical protein
MKSLTFIRITIPLIAMLTWCCSASAASSAGIGGIGSNLFSAIEGISDIIHVICGATGGALVLGSFFRYFAYRRNPMVAPLSSVFTLLLAGLCLIGLIFIPIGQA